MTRGSEIVRNKELFMFAGLFSYSWLPLDRVIEIHLQTSLAGLVFPFSSLSTRPLLAAPFFQSIFDVFSTCNDVDRTPFERTLFELLPTRTETTRA